MSSKNHRSSEKDPAENMERYQKRPVSLYHPNVSFDDGLAEKSLQCRKNLLRTLTEIKKSTGSRKLLAGNLVFPVKKVSNFP